jgi:hypothetical protein
MSYFIQGYSGTYVHLGRKAAAMIAPDTPRALRLRSASIMEVSMVTGLLSVSSPLNVNFNMALMPGAMPEVMPGVMPEVMPEVRPEVMPVMPEVVPEVMVPEVVPEVMPEVMPEVICQKCR